MEAVGSLLGQGHYGRISSSSSNHILAGCWLFFGVIISTAYRGSLIASLTLPRQPARPETVEDLVTSVERVTYKSFRSSHKEFLLKSESPTYQTLGDMIYIGVDIMDGLRDALRKK
ncbi:hypothetical protein Pmani_006057 [Petrolisthes manimaculis]|uniref:Ionotropic glutamate receptor C-terminal domain-containing protein n=1 Tax=Petrolisthes manimaculis TaxID=1843537 RepID=A0AAE1UJY9_9EUCA|nr:hypothetical protein Pmani_006057 [Petrolisthes manimaculis]